MRYPDLRCQCPTTGRTLKLVRLDRGFKTDEKSTFEGYAISPHGRFLALLYRSGTEHPEISQDENYVLNIYELPDYVDFKGSSFQEWCKLVKVVYPKSPFLQPLPQPLVIDSHNTLYSPMGRLELEPNNAGPTANRANVTVSVVQQRFPARLLGHKSLAYSGNSQFIIAYNPQASEIRRYKTLDLSIDAVASIGARLVMVCCVSNSGNLIVWASVSFSNKKYYIHDFAQGLCTPIIESHNIKFPAHLHLRFSPAEDFLVK